MNNRLSTVAALLITSSSSASLPNAVVTTKKAETNICVSANHVRVMEALQPEFHDVYDQVRRTLNNASKTANSVKGFEASFVCLPVGMRASQWEMDYEEDLFVVTELCLPNIRTGDWDPESCVSAPIYENGKEDQFAGGLLDSLLDKYSRKYKVETMPSSQRAFFDGKFHTQTFSSRLETYKCSLDEEGFTNHKYENGWIYPVGDFQNPRIVCSPNTTNSFVIEVPMNSPIHEEDYEKLLISNLESGMHNNAMKSYWYRPDLSAHLSPLSVDPEVEKKRTLNYSLMFPAWFEGEEAFSDELSKKIQAKLDEKGMKKMDPTISNYALHIDISNLNNLDGIRGKIKYFGVQGEAVIESKEFKTDEELSGFLADFIFKRIMKEATVSRIGGSERLSIRMSSVLCPTLYFEANDRVDFYLKPPIPSCTYLDKKAVNTPFGEVGVEIQAKPSK